MGVKGCEVWSLTLREEHSVREWSQDNPVGSATSQRPDRQGKTQLTELRNKLTFTYAEGNREGGAEEVIRTKVG
jgi:hypothetical protein